MAFTAHVPGVLKRFRRLIVGAALMTLVVFLVVLVVPMPQGEAQRLPDGSSVRILSVDYGHSHIYRLPPPKQWQQFLAKYLPAPLTDHFRWWDTGGGVGNTARPGENNLAIVTIREQSDFVGFWPPVRLEVWDEKGHLLDTLAGGARSGNFGQTRRRDLVCWTSSQIPFTAPALVIRISTVPTNSSDRPGAVEFRMPNPVADVNRNPTPKQSAGRRRQ